MSRLFLSLRVYSVTRISISYTMVKLAVSTRYTYIEKLQSGFAFHFTMLDTLYVNFHDLFAELQQHSFKVDRNHLGLALGIGNASNRLVDQAISLCLLQGAQYHLCRINLPLEIKFRLVLLIEFASRLGANLLLSITECLVGVFSLLILLNHLQVLGFHISEHSCESVRVREE